MNAIKMVMVFSLTWTLSPARADFVATDFASAEGWQLNGDAAIVDGRLRLTPAAYYQRGSAWYKTQQSVIDGFYVKFQFSMTDWGANPGSTLFGGDGLAFVIQNSSVTAIGDYGSGIGYSGAAPRDSIRNSLAVEFDTWRNTSLNDPNANHLSVHTRGVLPNSAHEDDSLGSTTAIADLSQGGTHTVAVQYAPGVMDIFVDDLTTPVLVAPVDLDATLAMSSGRAWIGFTASTWNGWANHDILSASFQTIPEPNVAAILVIALIAAGLVRRSSPGRTKR